MPALAHGVRFGLNIGIPLFPPAYYYPPPVYYYPPPVVVQTPPPVYIERREVAAPAPAPAEQWWYYCPDSKTYYPYVQQCASPWQRVSPHPPGT
jgi:hypothetical protein